MSNDSIREVIGASCCKFYNTNVIHQSLQLLVRVVNIARARHGWQCMTIRDELDRPTWRVYISDKKLTEEELILVKVKQGPIQTLKDILDEIAEDK